MAQACGQRTDSAQRVGMAHTWNNSQAVQSFQHQVTGFGVAAHISERPAEIVRDLPHVRGRRRADRATAGGDCWRERSQRGYPHALSDTSTHGRPANAGDCRRWQGRRPADEASTVPTSDQVTGSFGSPGSLTTRIALTRSVMAGSFRSGEPITEDRLSKPVHLQAAIIDPGQRLPAHMRQGLPPGH